MEAEDPDAEAGGGGWTIESFAVGFETGAFSALGGEGGCDAEAFVPNDLEALGTLPGMTPRRRRSCTATFEGRLA